MQQLLNRYVPVCVLLIFAYSLLPKPGYCNVSVRPTRYVKEDEDGITTLERRQCFPVLDAVPQHMSNRTYNPLSVVNAVNVLQPFGKERSLSVIMAFVHERPAIDHDGLFLVLRVLFDVPKDPGYLPTVGIGAFSPPGPDDPKRLPRFPILLIDDLPLLLVQGVTGSGMPESIVNQVKYFHASGTLRGSLLRPPAHPIEIWTRIQAFDAWIFTLGANRDGTEWPSKAQQRSLIWNQLRRAEEMLHPDPQDQHFSLNDRLILAIEAGRPESIGILLKSGADPNCRDAAGEPVLSLAVYNHRDEIVRLLLECGANVRATNTREGTALMYAARYGSANSVRLLIERGADVRARAVEGTTALLDAALRGSPECIKLLLDHGADPTSANAEGITPLLAAAQSESVRAIRLLLAHGAQISERDREGNTALIVAMPGSLNVTTYLLAQGLDPDAQNINGRTALMVLLQNSTILEGSRSGKEKLYHLVQLLLDHEASPNLQDQSGRTALMEAVESTHDPAIVKLLLQHGADPNEKDTAGETALDEARELHDRSLVQLLTTIKAQAKPRK